VLHVEIDSKGKACTLVMGWNAQTARAIEKIDSITAGHLTD
jgi:hypothetical protein